MTTIRIQITAPPPVNARLLLFPHPNMDWLMKLEQVEISHFSEPVWITATSEQIRPQLTARINAKEHPITSASESLIHE